MATISVTNQQTAVNLVNAETNAQMLTGPELIEKSEKLRAEAEKRAQAEQSRAASSRQLFTPGVPDALMLVDELLGQFINTSTNSAESKAKEIETKAGAIAELTRLWDMAMTEFSKYVNPNDPGDRVEFNGAISEATRNNLREIDRIIKTQLGIPAGIAEITGVNIEETLNLSPNYSGVQSMKAVATAFTDKIQVRIDTLQQEFKNEMTEITSAQEEIRNVAQFIVQLSQP